MAIAGSESSFSSLKDFVISKKFSNFGQGWTWELHYFIQCLQNQFISHFYLPWKCNDFHLFRCRVPVIAVLMRHQWVSSWRLVKAGVSFLCHPVHTLPDGDCLRVRDVQIFLEKQDYLIRWWVYNWARFWSCRLKLEIKFTWCMLEWSATSIGPSFQSRLTNGSEILPSGSFWYQTSEEGKNYL